MSEVISFRLDKNNLREAKALLILQEWRTKGYSIRRILTDALLKLDESHFGAPSLQIIELNDKFDQLLNQLTIGHPTQIINHQDKAQNPELADHFIASIRKAARTGMKLD